MSRPISIPTLFLLAALAAAAPAPADPGAAEGRFQHRDQVLEVSHGVAVSWPDPGAAGGRRYGVLLADAPPDAGHGVGAADPLAAIGNRLPFGSRHLSLQLQGPASALTVRQLFFLATGLHAAGNGDERLRVQDGQLLGEWTLPPTEVFGAHYQGRLRFDLPVVTLDAGTVR